ncbi:MAG: hypothetical protein L6R43_10230 [Planctomycetes bacterium]|nr:hypothetical protein [Planctomycetota bacterium]
MDRPSKDGPSPPPGGESPSLARLRRWGLLLLVLASFLPYHGCIAHPREFEPPPPPTAIVSSSNAYDRNHEPYTPAGRIEWILRSQVLGQEGTEAADATVLGTAGTSDDYGYLVFFGLLPWLLVLGLARGAGARRRSLLGRVAWTASALLPPALFWAMREQNIGIGEAPLPLIEAWLAAAGAAVVLAWRPPRRRRPEDLEATLSTHAALGVGIVLFRPALNYLEWIHLQGRSPGAAALAFLHNYRPGFWVTLLGLVLLAAPLYFHRRRLLRRYDVPLPCPSRSSTPTPTSTSTGSTPTGTPSSTGRAPRGSSPS